jgi:flagellar M-ring protein FliF
MNEWFKKVFGQLKALWGKWTVVQKLIVVGIALGAVVLIVVGLAVSGSPTSVRLINTAIKDEAESRRIGAALEKENIAYEFSADGYFLVRDEAIAKRAKAVLIREDLIHKVV